jgi:hypothetical protein
MSRDKGGGPARRPRTLERARVGWPRPLRELKDLLYEVYLAAGVPTLDEISEIIYHDGDLPGAPSRDTVHRCISASSLPAGQSDTVSVARALARGAAWDEQDLAGRVRDLWVAAQMATGAGRPIGEFDDRLVLADLEVHQALDAGVARDRLGALPAYIPREHDRQLQAVVAAAAAGHSRIAVLVGGSSTGKTRALWEAARHLPGGWRLWHPINPTRPDAALAELPDIAPKTVVWLNEAQHYLEADPLGEHVAAGLRDLLHSAARGPVLVLATLWPEHWDRLTARTGPDRHAQARELLGGHKIDVPDAFTAADLAALTDARDADPRLAEAADHAQDRQVTQYLAGVPVLMARYHAAPAIARALIHAAMDARRLGAGPHIPLAWLADAAPGYLTDTEWNTTGDDWLARALDYLTTPCNGISGILTPVRTTAPRNQRGRRPAAVAGRAAGRSAREAQGPHYQLADYLDQYGRRHRTDQIPPIDFWTAAATHAHPADLTALGYAAWNRGLYRDAAQLHKHATAHGSTHAATALVDHFHDLYPTDSRPVQWAAAHAPLDDPYAVARLLGRLRGFGAGEQVATLLARDPAAHASLDYLHGVDWLLDVLVEVGAEEQAAALAARAAAHAPLDHSDEVATLLGVLVEVGTEEQAATLAARAATHLPLDDPGMVELLLEKLVEVGTEEQAATLAARAATHLPLDNPSVVARLLGRLRGFGAGEQVAALLARDPAAHAPLDHPDAVATLLLTLRTAGAVEQASALAARAATHAPLHDPDAVARLLENLRVIGAEEQVAALLARDPAAHASLDDPQAVAGLLGPLWASWAEEQASALAARAAAHTPLDNPDAVGVLLVTLWAAGAVEQASALAARAAAHTPLDNPVAVARLLNRLRKVGAEEQAAALAARAAAHTPLDRPDAVGELLENLRVIGAVEQAAALAARAATHAPLHDPSVVARLLNRLQQAGAVEEASALAARAAARTPLDAPSVVAMLLNRLREAGAEEQVATLLARDPAAHASLDDSFVVNLIDSLWGVGAEDQAAALIEHLPATGRFREFLQVSDHRSRFRFGREPDGSAAPSWAWDDLE